MTEITIKTARDAMAAHDSAATDVCVELEAWLLLNPSIIIPTKLMLAVDAWRVAAAEMMYLLPEPSLPVVTVDAIAGPMQDQTPKKAPPEYYAKALAIIEEWSSGLLSQEEYEAKSAALVDEYADDPIFGTAS